MAKPPQLIGFAVDFQNLLNHHINAGTSATGIQHTSSWGINELAQQCAVQPATVYNWTGGRAYPTPANFARLRQVFFGRDSDTSGSALTLIDLYNKYSPYWIYVKGGEPPSDASASQQVPAAFRFGIREKKLEVLSETPEAIDAPTANDLYDELGHKLRGFISSLEGSNIDQRVRSSAQMMLTGLGAGFSDVRPGVVLSRMRSMEAIRDAFSTDEGRESLFPGAVAAIDDICLSGRDLLAIFPIVREIERQRLALGLEHSPESVREVEHLARQVNEIANLSEIVAESAVAALGENDIGIEQAGSVNQKADLLADKLLVVRNFVSETVRFVIDSGLSFVDGAWTVVKPDFQEGARNAARILPPLAVIALVTSLAGPIPGIAALLHGDMFKPVANAVKRILAKD